MPVEYALLFNKPPPLLRCPKCKHDPFAPFLRGVVQRSRWSWCTLWLPIGTPRPYCAIICRACRDIVGWELP